MWEIDQHFQEGEKILYQGNPDWAGYIWGFIFVLLFTLGGFPSIIFSLLILGVIALKRLSTKYVITNKRVVGRYGILSEDLKSSTFKHITSVRVKQSVLNKPFNIGNIIVDTAGSGAGVEFVWHAVKNPVQVKNQIEKQIA